MKTSGLLFRLGIEANSQGNSKEACLPICKNKVLGSITDLAQQLWSFSQNLTCTNYSLYESWASTVSNSPNYITLWLRLTNNQWRTNFPFSFYNQKWLFKKKKFTFNFASKHGVYNQWPKEKVSEEIRLTAFNQNTCPSSLSGGHMLYLRVLAWCHSIIFALNFQ